MVVERFCSLRHCVHEQDFFRHLHADVPEPLNADRVIKGGTGYCIHLETTGKNTLIRARTQSCRQRSNAVFRTTLYTAVSFCGKHDKQRMPARVCICHVAAKEGRCAKKVADVSDFWCGQKEIKVLDPNITACAEKRDLMQQYIDTRAIIDFTQGLDIRLLNQYDIEDINKMRVGSFILRGTIQKTIWKASFPILQKLSPQIKYRYGLLLDKLQQHNGRKPIQNLHSARYGV